MGQLRTEIRELKTAVHQMEVGMGQITDMMGQILTKLDLVCAAVLQPAQHITNLPISSAEQLQELENILRENPARVADLVRMPVDCLTIPDFG